MSSILKRSFAAEGAGPNALEKRKRDRSNLGEVILNSVFCFLTSALAARIEFEGEFEFEGKRERGTGQNLGDSLQVLKL